MGFEKGQTVRLKEAYDGLPKGARAIVAELPFAGSIFEGLVRLDFPEHRNKGGWRDPNRFEPAELKFRKGQRVVVLKDDCGSAARKGATARVRKDFSGGPGELLDVEWDRNALTRSQTDGAYYPSVFGPAEPKFRKGQKLRVVQHTYGLPPKGSVVVADGDSFFEDDAEYVHIDGDTAGAWLAERFEAESFEAESFVPKFKKGQKVVTLDEISPLTPKGSVATVLRDFHPGNTYLQVSWDKKTSQMDGGYFPEHFEAVPEEKPLPPPTFLRGQTLECKEGAPGILRAGDIVSAIANSYIGRDGQELVQVEHKGKDRTFYAARFKAYSRKHTVYGFIVG